MKRIKYISLAALFFGLVSCGNSKESKDESVSETKTTNMAEHPSENLVDLIAHAEDSSWQLSVQFDGALVFTAPEKGISFSGQIDNKTVAQGADVVNLSAAGEKEMIKVNIDIVDCNKRGKRVDIMYKRLDQKKGQDFSGCGVYRGAPRLDDIWAVTHINEKELNPAKFPKDIPHFEINLRTKQISGFAGCNEVNGNLRFEYEKLFIEPLASTKMYCAELSKIENEILKILRNGPIYYKIKGNALILETTDGYLQLKKVD